jgi:hypothetical protein
MITFPKPRRFVSGQAALRLLSLSAQTPIKQPLARENIKPRRWHLVPPWRWM